MTFPLYEFGVTSVFLAALSSPLISIEVAYPAVFVISTLLSLTSSSAICAI